MDTLDFAAYFMPTVKKIIQTITSYLNRLINHLYNMMIYRFVLNSNNGVYKHVVYSLCKMKRGSSLIIFESFVFLRALMNKIIFIFILCKNVLDI